LASPNFDAVRIFLWHRFVRLDPVHITVLAGLVAIVSLAGIAGYALNNPQVWKWNDLLWQFTLLQVWGVTQSPGWNVPAGLSVRNGSPKGDSDRSRNRVETPDPTDVAGLDLGSLPGDAP
jgi:hypothetical protein